MPFFQQFTGINAVIFYAPQLFNSLGSGSDSALLSTVIIGAVNVGCTLVAVFGVDKFGRKPLLLEAGVQMFAAEVAIAIILVSAAHACVPVLDLSLTTPVFLLHDTSMATTSSLVPLWHGTLRWGHTVEQSMLPCSYTFLGQLVYVRCCDGDVMLLTCLRQRCRALCSYPPLAALC